MNKLKEKPLSKTEIENRLSRIANVLLLNASFIDNPGFLKGKMGIAIFFFRYAHYTGNKIFEDYAGELIDEIYEEINNNTPVDFANGLTGIGWGIEFLVENRFLDADTDEVLAEIDDTIYRSSLYRPFLLDNNTDLFSYGFYYISRLRERENDDNNLKTLFKKQHLIYLTDDCERILIQKQYLDFNIKSLSLDTLNSFIWFILEMHRLRLFPVKVEKLFHCLPTYIRSGLQSLSDWSGQDLMRKLTENVISIVEDKGLQNTFTEILSESNVNTLMTDKTEDLLINSFIKSTWQELLFSPYIHKDNKTQIDETELFSIINNEENWNQRLDNLNSNNMGLTGLAGLGLGLLSFGMNKKYVKEKVSVQ